MKLIIKKSKQVLSERERQLKPMKGEVDLKHLATKLNHASQKAIIKSGISEPK